MKPRNLIAPLGLALAALVLSLSACSRAGALGEDATAALADLREDYADAVDAGDLERLLSYWTEDGVLAAAEQRELRGREAIRGFYAALLTDSEVELSFHSEELRASGDWAFDRGVYTLTRSPREEGVRYGAQDGLATGQRGSYLLLLRHQDDGSWKMSYHLYNLNAARPRRLDSGS